MSIEAIGRRDFLTLRTRGTKKVLVLSCEHLYMQWMDVQHASARSGEAGEEGYWEGEPPTQVRTTRPADILGRLDQRLASVDVLRIDDPEWLTDRQFRREVGELITRFRRRGGRVERDPIGAGGDS